MLLVLDACGTPQPTTAGTGPAVVVDSQWLAMAQRCVRQCKLLPYQKLQAHLLMQFPAMTFEKHKLSLPFVTTFSCARPHFKIHALLRCLPRPACRIVDVTLSAPADAAGSDTDTDTDADTGVADADAVAETDGDADTEAIDDGLSRCSSGVQQAKSKPAPKQQVVRSAIGAPMSPAVASVLHNQKQRGGRQSLWQTMFREDKVLRRMLDLVLREQTSEVPNVTYRKVKEQLLAEFSAEEFDKRKDIIQRFLKQLHIQYKYQHSEKRGYRCRSRIPPTEMAVALSER